MANKRTVDLNQIAAQKPQTNVVAAGYAAGATARRGAALKKYNEPPAGGQGPAIPALEQPFQPGQTMASQAVGTRVGDHHRQATQAVSGLSGADSIVAGEIQTTAPPPGGVASVQDLQLIPTDALPQQATEDPAFRGGAGAMMAMQQPNMAAKYGVVRNGKHIPPEQLVRGGAAPAQQRQRRSPQEIARDLNAVAEAQKKAQPPAEKPESSELRAPDHLPRTDEEADAQAKKALDIQEELNDMDDLDFDALRREMEDNELNSPGQRKAVEARLQPLSIEDLIMKNYVQQRVPIVPGAFEPTYRSVTGDIQLRLKKMLTLESEKTKVSDAYLFDKFALMTTAAGLDMINHHHAPTMYDERGNFSEEKFWEKYEWVTKKPTHMLASLGTHYSWFEQRVRRLFKVDEGKGG